MKLGDWDGVNDAHEIGEFTIRHMDGRMCITMPMPDAPEQFGPHQTTWSVELPHQCDQWEVAYADTHEDAVFQMEKFVTFAQAALDKLRSM